MQRHWTAANPAVQGRRENHRGGSRRRVLEIASISGDEGTMAGTKHHDYHILPPDIGPLITTIGTMRSEEHTSELQSLMRISYAVFRLQKKKHTTNQSNLTKHTQN